MDDSGVTYSNVQKFTLKGKSTVADKNRTHPCFERAIAQKSPFYQLLDICFLPNGQPILKETTQVILDGTT